MCDFQQGECWGENLKKRKHDDLEFAQIEFEMLNDKDVEVINRQLEYESVSLSFLKGQSYTYRYESYLLRSDIFQ